MIFKGALTALTSLQSEVISPMNWKKNKTLFIPVVNLYKNEPEHLLLHSAQIYNLLKYQFIPLQF